MSGQFHGAEAFRYLPLLAHAWGGIDGPGARAVIKSGGDKDDLKARFSVMGEWAARGPAAAVKWMDALPEGPAKNEAWEDALRSWSKKDPMASSTYLSQMPAGPARDSAVSSLSRSIAREDPDAAIQWANSIQDPAARETALVRSVQLWGSKNQTAAADWIQSSGLQPEVQQRMMEPLKQKEPNPLKQKPSGFPKKQSGQKLKNRRD